MSSFTRILATPPEQKQAAIRHMVNRMNTYKLNDDNKHNEQQIIQRIPASNGFDISVVKHINKPSVHTRAKFLQLY
jgi:hypothetical protein